MHDPVNHPKHYTGHPSGVECITITEHMGFCLGNALKYIWRAGEKGDAIEDLQKARWYLDREIARLMTQRGQEMGVAGGSSPAGTPKGGAAVASPAAAAGLPRQNAPAAAERIQAAKDAGGRGYRTKERLALLQRDWPAGVQPQVIWEAMNRLPGPKVRSHTMLPSWARQHGIKRPADYDRRSPARRAAQQERRGQERAGGEVAAWAQVLAWAEKIDPDLVLRGSREERLAQVNELRALEGLRPFVVLAVAA